MGITCSWLSENFEPIEILLNLTYVPHPHTGATIRVCIIDGVEITFRKKVISPNILALQ